MGASNWNKSKTSVKGSITELWDRRQNMDIRGADCSVVRAVKEIRLLFTPLTPSTVESRWPSPRQLAETAICTRLSGGARNGEEQGKV